MATLLETTVARILKDKAYKSGTEFGNKDIQERFDVSKTTAAKALKSLKDTGSVIEGSKKGKYKLAVEAEAPAENEQPKEVENSTTEAPKTETTEAPAKEDARTEEEPCIEQTFEVYLNGSYLTTITAPLNELIAEVRASNPNATLESVDGNEAYFIKQKGTKA